MRYLLRFSVRLLRFSVRRLRHARARLADVVRRGRARIAVVVERRRVCARLRQQVPPPAGNSHILFFTPEAAVDPHFAAQCVLGKTLQERGHPVLFARCFNLFRRCPALEMYGLPLAASEAERDRVCMRCAEVSLDRLDAYDLPVVDLRPFAGPALRSKVRQAMAEAPDDLREFAFEGVAFGKLSAMSLVLSHKVSDLRSLSEDTRRTWLELIETSLMAYLLVDQVCSRHEIRQLVYYNDYGMLLGARMAAHKHGVPAVTLTHAAHRGGVDRSRYVLLHEASALTMLRQGEAWPSWRDLALSPELVREIGADTLVRLRATAVHVYSPPKTFGCSDLRSRLGLRPGRKVLAAFTSSLDEMMAIEATRAGLGYTPPPRPQPFADQISWLQALIDRVEDRDDRQLVVRIHPREGANKRENVVSQHLGWLRERFDRPFRNCRFVWPGDPVSSYDVAELADVALTSWSTIGLELARMGVPVLASTNGLASFPHADFLEWGETPEAYFACLERLLERSATLETIAHALRWYNLNNLATSLDLGDVIPDPDFTGLPEYRTPAEAASIESVIVGGRDIIELNQQRLRASQSLDGPRQEQEAVRRYLRRLVRFMMTGQDPAEDYELRWAEQPGGSVPFGGASLEPGGTGLVFRTAEGIWERDSPLCRRLARLCAKPLSVPRAA